MNEVTEDDDMEYTASQVVASTKFTSIEQLKKYRRALSENGYNFKKVSNQYRYSAHDVAILAAMLSAKDKNGMTIAEAAPKWAEWQVDSKRLTVVPSKREQPSQAYIESLINRVDETLRQVGNINQNNLNQIIKAVTSKPINVPAAPTTVSVSPKVVAQLDVSPQLQELIKKLPNTATYKQLLDGFKDELAKERQAQAKEFESHHKASLEQIRNNRDAQDSLTAQINTLQAKCDNYVNKYTQAKVLGSSYHMQLDNAETENKRLKVQNKQLRARAQETMDRLNKANNAHNDVIKDNDKLTNKINELTQKNAQLNDTLAALDTKLTDSHKSAVDVKTIQDVLSLVSQIYPDRFFGGANASTILAAVSNELAEKSEAWRNATRD